MKKASLLIFVVLLNLTTFAQKEAIEKVDLNELIAETQIQTGNDGQIHLYWWVPSEYWEVALSRDPNLTKADVKSFIEPIRDYTMLMVIRGKVGVFGNISYENRDSIRQSLVMIDENEQAYSPIPEKDLNEEIMSILTILKPMMSNMLGQMGSHVEFYVFSNKNKKGKEIFSPYTSKAVKARCMGDEVKWRTPLGSLFKKKHCPVDNEAFKGTWNYCPYHGDKLK